MCNDDGTLADHDRGLAHDLDTFRRHRERRSFLGLLGAGAVATGGAVLLDRAAGPAAASTGSTTAAAACERDEIPGETAGPYPGDGSNGPDVLEQEGVVRRDLRSSFAGATGTAVGVPLTLVMRLRSTTTCRVVQGLAVYAWHCDSRGRYSMYTSGIEDENYLRGVQVTGRKGGVRFTTVFPGCYSGRWPHVHFEVYRTRGEATSDGTPLVTSQLALPRPPAAAVYDDTATYPGSRTNLDRISLRSDNVFGDDGGARQLATVTGSVTAGYTARLVVPVDL